MKKIATRCIAGLCVAAGLLALAVPAQAAYVPSIDCLASNVTTGNDGWVACAGPTEGLLTGSHSELDDLQVIFRRSIPTRPFIYKGKSTDAGNGPFLNNPNSTSGRLFFDLPLLGVFVLGLEGENNYSYYLFNTSTKRVPGPIAFLDFDTQGVTDSTGAIPGPTLAFAALYVQQGPQAVPVPEPAGLGLIAAAFGALALTTRRRG